MHCRGKFSLRRCSASEIKSAGRAQQCYSGSVDQFGLFQVRRPRPSQRIFLRFRWGNQVLAAPRHRRKQRQEPHQTTCLTAVNSVPTASSCCRCSALKIHTVVARLCLHLFHPAIFLHCSRPFIFSSDILHCFQPIASHQLEPSLAFYSHTHHLYKARFISTRIPATCLCAIRSSAGPVSSFPPNSRTRHISASNE